MSNFKKKPKQKSNYPGILTRAEEFRKGSKFNKTYADQAKSANVRLAQRFSGKKGN